MKRYLLIASAPSSIPALVRRAQELHAAARDVRFVLLATRPHRVEDPDAAAHIATADALLAEAQLRRARLPVERTVAGDPTPIFAIDDELRARPNHYDAVVLATPPPGPAARLFARDLAWRARTLPVRLFLVHERPTGRLPVPLPVILGRILGLPTALRRSVQRHLARPRVGIAILLLPILAYLAAGLGLAIFVNRGFLFTEAVALLLYSAFVTGLVIIERTDPARRPPPLEDAETAEPPRER